MNTRWVTSAAVLLGISVFGVTLTSCGKEHSLTQTLEPKAKGDVVSSVNLAIQPAFYQGECPAIFSIAGEITMSDSGAVMYRWERSDGNVSEPGFVWFPAPGTKSVATAWSPPAPGSYWERLHVLIPDDVVSSRIGFVDQCAPFTSWAIVNVSPESYSGHCPAQSNFAAQISTNGH